MIIISNLHIRIFKESQNAIDLFYGDMTIKKGDFLYVSGDNGSGKSTLYNALTDRIHKIEGGTIRYLNISPLKQKDVFSFNDEESAELRRNISYLESEPWFRHNSTFYEALKDPAYFALKYQYLSDKKNFKNRKKELKKEFKNNRARIDEKIEYYFDNYLSSFFNIDSFSSFKREQIEHNLEEETSKGQRRFLSFFAHVIKTEIMNVSLFILDEPFTHLDNSNIKLVVDILKSLRKQNPSMVIMLTAHGNYHTFAHLITKKLTLEKGSKTLGQAKYVAKFKEVTDHEKNIVN